MSPQKPNTTLMKNIVAAAILGASIIVGVLLFIHHEDVMRAQDRRRVKCTEDKKAFDSCIMFGPPGNASIYQQCKASWQPEIDKDCSD
jgi:hypothetical protein